MTEVYGNKVSCVKCSRSFDRSKVRIFDFEQSGGEKVRKTRFICNDCHQELERRGR